MQREYNSQDCIISFLYIKPQPFLTTPSWPSGCIISFLYIKPQLAFKCFVYCFVVLYRFSTSNHNHSPRSVRTSQVVLYRFSTSNHNFSYWLYCCPFVVLYRFSTSNHNYPQASGSWCGVVLYRFSTSNHNCYPIFCLVAGLYYIVSLHQTTTRLVSALHG